MVDERVREAERRFKESGDDADGWRWCQEIVRAGGHVLDPVGLATRLYRLERILHTLLSNGAITSSPELDRVQNAFGRDPSPAEVAAYLRGVGIAGVLGDPPPPAHAPACRHGIVPPSAGHGGEHCARCGILDATPANMMCVIRVTWDDLPMWVSQHHSWTMEGAPPDLTRGNDEIEAWIIDRVEPHSTRRLGEVVDHAWDEARRILNLVVVLSAPRAGAVLSVRSNPGTVTLHHNGNTTWPRLGGVAVTLRSDYPFSYPQNPGDDPAQTCIIA